MKLLAHITTVEGKRKEQSLKEHCFHTAQYASESIGTEDLKNTVYLAGLLHDMGKGKQEYVQYLEAAYQGEEVERGSVNHTFAGVIWLFERFHKATSTKWERLTCELISYAVGSHHGMFDCVDLNGKNGFIHRSEKDKKEICYEEAVHNFLEQVAGEELLDGYFYKAVQEVEDFFGEARDTYSGNGKKAFFQISMLVRLVLSAVIYGDRRDTSEFMGQKKTSAGVDVGWEARSNFFDQRLEQFYADSELNLVRSEISRQCLEAAERPEGIYRLNIPTGSGKTLSSLRYAIAHAKKYKKKRIIFIIPLLSVLDQNVKVIRGHLPEQDAVLEHHSNVVRERSLEEELDQYEFLAESWNYPVIVSTMVQLLDILFTRQMSAVGRLQALCNSVIVIDEVQSLPKKATMMFNMAMNFLQQFCHATVVLSSATQPCFDELKWPLRLSKNSDLVRLEAHQEQVFKRSEILNCVDRYGMDWEDCVRFCSERMEMHPSLLIICNTKAEARILFEKMKGAAQEHGWELFHLSTALCQKHRLHILKELQDKLASLQKGFREGREGSRIVCISTQLIEAGVDLSFSGVVRILAGIDDLAQAAGRCNRSNEYGCSGKVYLINLKKEDLTMLHEIKIAQDCTRSVLEERRLAKGDSIIGEEATREYYRYLFEATKDEIQYPVRDRGTVIYLADLLSNVNPNIGRQEKEKKMILYQPFKTIGTMFKVFDQETMDVLVPYEKGEMLIEQLQGMQKAEFEIPVFKELMQQAKPYTVSIYQWQREKLEQAGMLYPLWEGRVSVLDKKAYHPEYGVTGESTGEVADHII